MKAILQLFGLICALLVAVAIMAAATHPTKPLTSASLASLAGTTADSHYPPNWAARLLALVGAPRTSENLRLLAAWGTAEGGTAKWNPLNATYPLPFGESWAYNGSSVQNYWRPTGGIAANVLTLIQTNYGGILGALQAGRLTASQIVENNRTQFRTWGTNPDVVLRVLAS